MPVITIDYSPHDYQVELHDSDVRFKIVVGGRRVGKSLMALHELIRHCITVPKAVGWWVAPTIQMAREVGWEEFLFLKDILNPGIITCHDTLMRVRFTNGSVMYFKGGDNEKSLRGRGLTMVVIDEAAFISEEIWTRAILPALADKQGKALLISTPNGRNWFWKTALDAQNPLYKERWGYWHWPSSMNPLMTFDELREISRNISEMDFRQEFLGEFVTRGGMVYDEFSANNILGGGIPSDFDYDIYMGMDFGYANPTAICFVAVNKQNGSVVMFDELYLTRTKIADILTEIEEKLYFHHIDPTSIKAIYTDPAGNAEELSSGISPVDYLRMCKHKFNVVNKKTNIAPGLALVRAFIANAAGERRFFVTNNCREAIKSITGYTYDKKDGSEVIKEEPLKDGIHDHMCDAIRYFFVNKFDHARYVGNKVHQFNHAQETNRQNKIMKRCAGPCRSLFLSSTPQGQPPFYCRSCNAE